MTVEAKTASPDVALTLPALMRRNVRDHGDRILLAVDDAQISYAQADARSRVLARGLLAAGAKKGSHIALLYTASADFLAATLAIARIGAVVVPLSTLSTADELRGLLAHSDTTFLLAQPQFRSQNYVRLLQAALPEIDLTQPPPLQSLTAPWLRNIWFSDDLPEGTHPGWSIAALEAMAAEVDDARLDAIEARVAPADRLAILHTSGSTGTPKGVMHQHGSMIAHLHNVNAARRYGPDDRYFTTFPFFWIAGFGYGLVATIANGGTILWSNATAPSDILDFLERERPSFTNGFWRSVTRLTEDPSFAGRDLSTIRRGNLWPILAPDVRPRDPSLRHDIYGMSETGPGVSLGPDDIDLPEHMRGSCGQFMPTFETKIVDPDTGAIMPRGEAGELWVRGPLMAEGYYGKPRTAVYDIDGWYRTNDIGVIDADGNFYWKARMGDMIKTSGVNVSPKEVESVLATLPGNRVYIVLGLPDQERDEVVIAAVISDQPVDEAQVKAQLVGKLSGYKIPRRIVTLAPSDIPLLANGKYNMPALRAVVQARVDTVEA